MLIKKDLIKRLKEENYEIKEECQATLSYNIDLESIDDTYLEILNEGSYETYNKEITPQISDVTYTIYKDGKALKNFQSVPIDDVKIFLEKFNQETLEKKYEKFKLQWMIDHDKTIKDLIRITSSIEGDFNEKLNSFELEYGFDEEIYPSFEEWCQNDINTDSLQVIKIPLSDKLSLIAKTNVSPFDKELNIYLDSDDCYQDIAIISPNYTIYPSTNTVHYDNDTISVKLFEDENDEDFTQDIDIPVYEGLKNE